MLLDFTKTPSRRLLRMLHGMTWGRFGAIMTFVFSMSLHSVAVSAAMYLHRWVGAYTSSGVISTLLVFS